MSHSCHCCCPAHPAPACKYVQTCFRTFLIKLVLSGTLEVGRRDYGLLVLISHDTNIHLCTKLFTSCSYFHPEPNQAQFRWGLSPPESENQGSSCAVMVMVGEWLLKGKIRANFLSLKTCCSNSEDRKRTRNGVLQASVLQAAARLKWELGLVSIARAPQGSTGAHSVDNGEQVEVARDSSHTTGSQVPNCIIVHRTNPEEWARTASWTPSWVLGGRRSSKRGPRNPRHGLVLSWEQSQLLMRYVAAEGLNAGAPEG